MKGQLFLYNLFEQDLIRDFFYIFNLITPELPGSINTELAMTVSLNQTVWLHVRSSSGYVIYGCGGKDS